MNSNELIHYGVPGMKWGVRHDKPTSGRRTYNSSDREKAIKNMSDDELRKANSRHAAEAMYKKNNMTDQEYVSKLSWEATQNAKTITSGLKNINQKSKSKKARLAEAEQKKRINEKLSKMSDAELKSIVNRMNLEQQYERLSSSTVQTGKDRVGDVLDTVGDVLVVAGGIATLAVNLKGLAKHIK